MLESSSSGLQAPTCTVQYSTVQYSTVQYSTVQYSTVQYTTVQYSTVLPHRDEAHLLVPLQNYPPGAVSDLGRVGGQGLGCAESMRQCKENGGK